MYHVIRASHPHAVPRQREALDGNSHIPHPWHPPGGPLHAPCPRPLPSPFARNERHPALSPPPTWVASPVQAPERVTKPAISSLDAVRRVASPLGPRSNGRAAVAFSTCAYVRIYAEASNETCAALGMGSGVYASGMEADVEGIIGDMASSLGVVVRWLRTRSPVDTSISASHLQTGRVASPRAPCAGAAPEAQRLLHCPRPHEQETSRRRFVRGVASG